MIAYLTLLLLGGALWNFHLGMFPLAASLALPTIATRLRTWRVRWLGASLYMAAAMLSIVPSFHLFFPHASLVSGAGLWLAAAVLLGAPYALAKDGKRAVLAVLLQSIPPLGVIAFVSPLDAAGLLFPKFGLVGVVLLLVLLWAWCDALNAMLLPGVHPQSNFDLLKADMVIVLPLLALGMHFFVAQPKAPQSWVGVSTHHILPDGGSVFKSIAGTQSAVHAVQSSASASRAAFVVLPEAVLGDAYPGTLALMQSSVRKGQQWLVGVENGRDDAVWLFARGTKPHPVFESAMPMPLAMWRPGSGRSYTAHWFEPVRRIGHERVFASICVEQVMPWVWLEAAWQHPTLILAPSNAWWATANNAAPRIQAIELRAWARLLGVPVISANNTR